MKEVVVLSGKGGTGKTSIVGCFASLAKNKVLADCDVDAADLHLLLQPKMEEENEFWSGQTAFIDKNRCTQCGLCQELCRFNAIKDYKVESVSCEGCGFCAQICPADAITMKENMAGHWFLSNSRYGTLVHARLGIAEENSGKLVALVRQKAREVAEKEKTEYIISDGPPGIGCPVISSLSGTDLAVLVTEPTLSGIHDLERVHEVCRHFDVPALVCINKYNINESNSDKIENYCKVEGMGTVIKIPYDNIVTEAMIKGIPVVEYSKNGPTKQITLLWNKIVSKLGK